MIDPDSRVVPALGRWRCQTSRGELGRARARAQAGAVPAKRHGGRMAGSLPGERSATLFGHPPLDAPSGFATAPARGMQPMRSGVHMTKKLISVVTGCMNEKDNVGPLYERLTRILADLPQYDYEIVFADNASTDETPEILRSLAAADHRVKVIFNMRNFGQVRSPYHALLEARGDAMIAMASDLEDPPELIPEFLRLWEDEQHQVVLGQKSGSEESRFVFVLRSIYYKVIRRLSDVELLDHVTGFGLYDREVVEQMRALNDPYPYVRGLISELGYPVARVQYSKPQRTSGISKNNLYSLYDLAMLGFTSHSKVPLRLAAMLGFVTAMLSLTAGLVYLIYKLLFWSQISVGVAPLVIGLFFFSSVQLIFLGIVGEYVGAIHTQVQRRPLVVERERLNFDERG
jgi:glycosyltransferase involved in cell wall biosynthesis